MNKKLLVLIAILLTVVASPTIKSAHAASAQYWWIPPYAYISGYNVAYDDGATAALTVAVYNDVNNWGYNVSKVILNFRYLGINKTVDLSAAPQKITLGNAKTYNINFTASAAEFPVQWHSYRIIIENMNSTTAPMKQNTPLIYSPGSFAVYTADETDAENLYNEFWNYANQYPWYYFDSVEAEHTAFDALQQGYLGDDALDLSNYAAAKAYYEAGITLYKQALATEETYETTWEQADLNTTLSRNTAIVTGANANMTWAEADMTRALGERDAALANANGFLAIGIGFAIGWSLIGVGAIIYAFRKPKPAT